MHPHVSASVEAVFALLAIATLSAVLWFYGDMLKRAGLSPAERSRRLRRAVVLGLGWKLLVAVLAVKGFFRDFEAMPPRLAFIVVPMLGFLVWASLSPWIGRLVRTMRLERVYYLQTFRVAVEFMLWWLYAHGVMPRVMTFGGRNYDIFVGLTAPVIAWVAQLHSAKWRRARLAWNFAGMAVLMSVVVHGLLSAPTPFRKVFDGVSTAIIAEFPFAWLPATLVTTAFFLHILAIRGERARQRAI